MKGGNHVAPFANQGATIPALCLQAAMRSQTKTSDLKTRLSWELVVGNLAAGCGQVGMQTTLFVSIIRKPTTHEPWRRMHFAGCQVVPSGHVLAVETRAASCKQVWLYSWGKAACILRLTTGSVANVVPPLQGTDVRRRWGQPFSGQCVLRNLSNVLMMAKKANRVWEDFDDGLQKELDDLGRRVWIACRYHLWFVSA